MANQNNFFLSSGLHHDSNFLRSLPDEDEQSASNHGPPWLDRSRQSRHSPGDRRLPWSPLQQSPPAAAAFTTQANSYTGPEYRPVISGSSNSHYLEARSFLFNTPGRARHQEPSRPTLTYASVPLDHQIPRFIPPAVESPSNLDQYINEPHPDPAVRQHFLWPSDPEPIMPSASRPRKRSAAEATTERPKKARHDSEELEEVNLTSDDPIEAALEKERQELVKSQQKDSEDEPKSFGKMSCIICMDNFTDVTATACGHIFCHECLTQALNASERNDRGTGSCPVCRKTLKRTQKNHIIPLAFMTKKKYQSTRRV